MFAEGLAHFSGRARAKSYQARPFYPEADFVGRGSAPLDEIDQFGQRFGRAGGGFSLQAGGQGLCSGRMAGRLHVSHAAQGLLHGAAQVVLLIAVLGQPFSQGQLHGTIIRHGLQKRGEQRLLPGQFGFELLGLIGSFLCCGSLEALGVSKDVFFPELFVRGAFQPPAAVVSTEL